MSLQDEDISSVLIRTEQLQQRIYELGQQLTEDYADKDPLLVGVLKGAVMFMVDLMREVNLPLEVDFMAVASYGSSTESTGVVRILKDLDQAIEGRHVLVVHSRAKEAHLGVRMAVSRGQRAQLLVDVLF